jgi:hypothetical protein
MNAVPALGTNNLPLMFCDKMVHGVVSPRREEPVSKPLRTLECRRRVR